MRQFIYDLLRSDDQLAIITGGGIPIIHTAPSADDVLERPFFVIRWGVTNPGIARVDRQEFTLWAHDDPADYNAHVLPMLRRARELFEGVAGQPVAGLHHIHSISWQGNSSDLIDEAFSTIARNSGYRLVGTGG
jgi:hypothetical protein